MGIEYKAWPYRQASLILEKLEREALAGVERKHDYVLLETGFGPSGLPHIGTFGEVARTSWVQQALERMSGKATKLFAFSDDMDGMRGIPDNVPNPELLKEHLGKPLSDVPDPFGEQDSFAGYSNAKLCSFLDSFGFDYEFKSSRDQYRGGVFNEGLKLIVDRYDAVRDVVTKGLSEDNRQSWSPFQPVCESCGRVNTTRVMEVHGEDHSISYSCTRSFDAKQAGQKIPVRGCGHEGRVSVTDGHVKVGWKVDWALRWYVLGVDYEMYGKDLVDSAVVSSEIVRILGGEPPATMQYEWFNDERGQSISKSKGNGLTIDQWLTYGPVESMSWYIYQSPHKAKKLHFDVIPKSVDDFLQDRRRFGQDADNEEEQVNNPVFFVEQAKIKAGQTLNYESDVTYGLLLNLVSVLNTDDRQIIWEYLIKYDPEARQNEQMLDSMIDCALRYYRDFVVPTKQFVAVPEEMLGALDQFKTFLAEYEGSSAEELQTACYEAGKSQGLKLGSWFKALYQLLLGQSQGPRIGTFAQLYGAKATLELIEQRQAELGA